MFGPACRSGVLREGLVVGITAISLVFGVAALPPSAQHRELTLGEGAGESLLDFLDVGEFLVGPLTRVTGVVTHAAPPGVAPHGGPGCRHRIRCQHNEARELVLERKR